MVAPAADAVLPVAGWFRLVTLRALELVLAAAAPLGLVIAPLTKAIVGESGLGPGLAHAAAVAVECDALLVVEPADPVTPRLVPAAATDHFQGPRQAGAGI